MVASPDRYREVLAASSGVDLPSMIALASSRILELGATLLEELPTTHQDRCILSNAPHGL